MSDSLLAFLGIAGGIVNTIGLVPYIRDILSKKTKPERATWWIWLALNLIAFWALLSTGWTWYLAMMIAQIGAVCLIAILSLKYGYGKFKRRDIISLVIAAIGIVLWKLTNQPIAALLIVMCVDSIGLWLTLVKTWEAPHTETLISWVLAAAASVLGLIAVGSWDPTKLVYPAYIAIGNASLIFVIHYRRPKVPITKEAKE